MTQYDDFGSRYDDVVGDRPELSDYVMSLLKKFAPHAENVLELGCGSGSILKPLAKKYTCVGIDISAAQIKVARKKVPSAQFHVGDIRTFALPSRFDAIICVFDTINHLTAFGDWKRLFRCAARHLSEGGVFIFDMNTEYKLDSYIPVAEETDRGWTIVDVKRTRRSRYVVSMTTFERSGRGLYKRFDMHIPELTVPAREVVQALKREFADVTIRDPDRALPTTQSEELFFICKGVRRSG